MRETNFFSVEKEKTKAEQRAFMETQHAKPKPVEFLKKGFKANEERLKLAVEEEKARREAATKETRAPAKIPTTRVAPPQRAPEPQVQKVRFAPPAAAPSEPRPDTAASVHSVMSESQKPDAPFRAELMSMPESSLRRFIAEIGERADGDKRALVDRLMAHARKMNAERQAAPAPTPPSASSTTSSRREDTAQPRPDSALSVQSLSLEPPGSARPGTGQSFVPANSFGGGKPNYVFKKDARGVGYYKDRPAS